MSEVVALGVGWQSHPENRSKHVDEQRFHSLHPTFENQYGDPWEVTDLESLLVLQGLVRGLRPRTVVETGTYRGVGTNALARALSDDPQFDERTHRLYTIDNAPHASVQVPVLKNSTSYLVGSSSEVPWESLLDGRTVDFAYIDCWNRGPAIKALLPFTGRHTVIAVHDWFHKKTKTLNEGVNDLISRGRLRSPTVIATARGLALFNVKYNARKN